MASLYIKDSETADLAQQVASRLGTTKTDAVRRALRSLVPQETSSTHSTSTVQWLLDYRAAHPLPDRERMKADKAFYDSLNDEDDICDPWAE
jgi:antitoxin VapB